MLANPSDSYSIFHDERVQVVFERCYLVNTPCDESVQTAFTFGHRVAAFLDERESPL